MWQAPTIGTTYSPIDYSNRLQINNIHIHHLKVGISRIMKRSQISNKATLIKNNGNVNSSNTASRGLWSYLRYLSENDVRKSDQILASLHTENLRGTFLQSPFWVYAGYIVSPSPWVYLPGSSNKPRSFWIGFNNWAILCLHDQHPQTKYTTGDHAGQWFI